MSSITIYVVNPPAVSVSGISLNSSTLTIHVGESYSDIKASILPFHATNSNVVWTSSNTSVATVCSNGIVSGMSNGVVTITATTVDGSYSATCMVTVLFAVSGLVLDTGLHIGQSLLLLPTIQPLNASIQTVVWASSDSTVASVNRGVVTGIAIGTTTITATSTDSTNICTSVKITVV